MSDQPVWNLVADIGGTNARFSALLEGQLESEFEFHHSVEEYPLFSDLVVKLRDEIAAVTGLSSAVLAQERILPRRSQARKRGRL